MACRIALGILLIVALGQGCAPKYMAVNYNQLWTSSIWPEVAEEKERYEKYELRFSSVYFFRNNQITHALLSKRSTGLSGGQLFYADASQPILTPDTTQHFSEAWHEFVVWKPIDENNKKVYVASTAGKGRTEEKEKMKSSYLFEGVVQEYRAEGALTAGLKIMEIHRRVKMIPKGKMECSIKHGKDEDSMAFIFRDTTYQGVPIIEVLAVIDKGVEHSANHMQVYEIDQIFGENLYLVKQ